MENVAGEQDLALQQHFPYKTSKFSENSNCRINLLFHSRGLKLGHFGIFDESRHTRTIHFSAGPS